MTYYIANMFISLKLNINIIYMSNESNNSIFDFINDDNKKNLLIKANELLNINKAKNNILIFVYSAPKVGSTSIVSSLRIFGSNKFDIIHIHDEEMLRVLSHVSGISINELILYNKYLGKDTYVIDIFRSPIERKISTFFEKIGSYHFNNIDSSVNNYNIYKVINRFNNIFPYIGIGDHFMDKYNIPIPNTFDYDNKFLLVNHNGIKYIKLRLKDSNLWGDILSNIFATKICIVKDYESTSKPIKNLYQKFKSTYKIPKNLLDYIINCKHLNYYYSSDEITQYYNEWFAKSCLPKNPYTLEQYTIYEEITLENSHIDYIQVNHYLDEGCMCKACGLKRAEVSNKIIRGVPVNERVIHTEAKSELIKKTVVKVNKINNAIKQIPQKGNRFNGEMQKLVVGRRF